MNFTALIRKTLQVGSVLFLCACQTGQKSGDPSLSRARLIGIEPYTGEVTPPLAPLNISLDQVGYLLYDPQTKEVLSHHQSDRSFIPASVTKIASTFAALQILGPDYRFKTELLYTGQIKNHTLKGDLYLKGSGDPLLTASDLMNLAEALQEKGIQKLEGNFYYDETFLPTQEAIDPTQDSSQRFNPGLSALSLEFNQRSLYWKPSLQKSAVDSSVNSIMMKAYALPDFPEVEFRLAPQVTPEGFSYHSTTNPTKEIWQLSPDTLSAGKKSIPIKNPGAYTASLFSSFAKMNGIDVPMPHPRKAPASARVLALKKGLPLVELSGKILEYSNNMMTELVYLSAMRKLKGKAVTLKNAGSLLAEWYKKQTPSKAHPTLWDRFILENGSGLGSFNRVTPEQLVSILTKAERTKIKTELGPISFLSLLPVSGWKGSLTQRMAEPNTGLRVWSKTGSQGFCNSLAGYLFTRSGRKLAFAILTTDYDQRAYIDLQGNQVSPQLMKKAKLWGDQMRSFEDQLITLWIEKY